MVEVWVPTLDRWWDVGCGTGKLGHAEMLGYLEGIIVPNTEIKIWEEQINGKGWPVWGSRKWPGGLNSEIGIGTRGAAGGRVRVEEEAGAVGGKYGKSMEEKESWAGPTMLAGGYGSQLCYLPCCPQSISWRTEAKGTKWGSSPHDSWCSHVDWLSKELYSLRDHPPPKLNCPLEKKNHLGAPGNIYSFKQRVPSQWHQHCLQT